MSKLRVTTTMSLDGYVAGPDQSEENPLGVGGMELHQWLFPLKVFREAHGGADGETNASSPVVEERRARIGATIMGRNMFGPVRGSWPDDSWRGWWGEDPPYHHPVFVLTHHARKPGLICRRPCLDGRDRRRAAALVLPAAGRLPPDNPQRPIIYSEPRSSGCRVYSIGTDVTGSKSGTSARRRPTART